MPEWARGVVDILRASGALDPGSIPGEPARKMRKIKNNIYL